jgi:hypothetical protein
MIQDEPLEVGRAYVTETELSRNNSVLSLI